MLCKFAHCLILKIPGRRALNVVSSVDGHIGGKEWSLKDVDFFSSGEKSAVDCQRESLIVVIIQFSELFEKI